MVLVCGGIYEVRTKRDALFPVTAFKDSTTSKLFCESLRQAVIYYSSPVIILVVSFLHNLAFNAGTFYLALYYQV